MDWLLLIVLVPLVIVPIVLLYGFAGCGSFGTSPPPPLEAPFDLVAKAVSTSQINLAWKHASSGGVSFIISFLGPEGSWNENYKTVTGAFTAESTSLAEGVFYSFRVRAAAGGVETV